MLMNYNNSPPVGNPFSWAFDTSSPLPGKTANTQVHNINTNKNVFNDVGKRKLVPTKKPLTNSHINYYNHMRNYNSRASKVKTKAKIIMPEIARNSVPPDKSLLLPPTPAIDTQIATVKRDSINPVLHGFKHRIHLALKVPELSPSRTNIHPYIKSAILVLE